MTASDNGQQAKSSQGPEAHAKTREECVEFAMKKLAEKVQGQIDKYTRSRNFNRRAAYLFKVAIIVLGGATTILLGIKGFDSFKYYDQNLEVAAFLISSIVTMVAAFESFANFTWKWVRYRKTIAGLHDVLDCLVVKIDKRDEFTSESLVASLNQFRAVLTETNSDWETGRGQALRETQSGRKP